MEVVPGILGSLPILPQFPGCSIISSILPEEWQACLEAWIFAVEFRLRLLPDHFRHFKLASNASGMPFLLSYYQQFDYNKRPDVTQRLGRAKERKLDRQCFLLTRRLLTETDLPYDCTHGDLFALLADMSLGLGANASWRDTLKIAWKRSTDQVTSAIEKCKGVLIHNLPQSSTAPDDGVLLRLQRLTAVTKALPEAGEYLMTGSDYLDSLITGYEASRSTLTTSQASQLSRQLTENLFFCLRSLMISDPPHSSLLLDHLYHLKDTAERMTTTNPGCQTILSSLVCSTSLLKHLDIFISTHEQNRGKALVQFLYAYRERTIHLHPPNLNTRSKAKKGKRKAAVEGEMHIHQASQVSRIQELFPDLPSAYIVRLLDHLSNDVEAVTAALLEPDSLPADLRDRNVVTHTWPELNGSLKDSERYGPISTIPQRRNVFDGDDFDNLQISSPNIHMGRRDAILETPKNTEEHTKAKAAIMAALAAFDSDDDERDDTYDVGDVGGTVDTSMDTDVRPRAQRTLPDNNDAYEEVLFGAWRNMPHAFARDSSTRLSQPRRKLKEETGMTDEQIEGWAIMLGRDKALLSRLEKKYSLAFAFGGQQHKLAGTKWSASRSGTATENEDSAEDGVAQGSTDDRGRGSLVRRGTRGFGRGHGGSTSGPSFDPATQAARRRKEQGRGRGGTNHNRREGRAKKIARGMTGPLA